MRCHRATTLVESFENSHGLFYDDQGEIALNEVGSLPPEEQKELFGGTLAPNLRLQLDGTETRIVSELNDGHFLSSGGLNAGGSGNGNGRDR